MVGRRKRKTFLKKKRLKEGEEGSEKERRTYE